MSETQDLVQNNLSDSNEPLTMSLHNPPKNFYRFITSCFWYVSVGINDGCVGPILPNIEAYYHVSYSMVSLIWLGNCLGFILVAILAQFIKKHFKFHQIIYIPALIQIIQFALIASGTKFPVIVVAYFLGGVAAACGVANHNYYITRFENASTYLGILHGCYGLGATVGPLIASVMVNVNAKWNYFFFILLGYSIFNILGLYWAFEDSDNDFSPFEKDIDENNELEKSDIKQAIKLIRTWLVSFFVFFYQGAEVGFGSWYVTFLLDYRHGPQSSRYVASGFWLGVTISRVLISPLGVKYLGNRRSNLILIAMVIVFDIFSWLVPNEIAAGVMASFVGFFLGPVYPLMIGLVSRILPRKVQVVSMIIMTAFGSSGGALFPFIIGIMSQNIDIWILHPMFLGLSVMSGLVWIALPNVERIGKTGLPKNFWERIW